MNYTPAWRLKFRRGKKGSPVVQSDDFKAKRKLHWFGNLPDWMQCTKIARSTGKRCRQPRMIGSTHCIYHKGYYDAVAEEQRRFPKHTVIVDRSKAKRKEALAQLGATMQWPEDIPRRPDLTILGPLARGRLFEAWLNREMAPDVWRHELTRERVRALPKR